RLSYCFGRLFDVLLKRPDLCYCGFAPGLRGDPQGLRDLIESLGIPQVDCFNVTYLLSGHSFYFLLVTIGKLLKLVLKFLNLRLKLGAGLPHYSSDPYGLFGMSWILLGAILRRR